MSSRCAITTIASLPGDWAGATAVRFLRRTRPPPGSVCVQASTFVAKPYGASCSRNHCAAASAPELPGERSGYSVASSFASWSVARVSKAGGRSGFCSGRGRVTVKAAIRSGSEQARKALR